MMTRRGRGSAERMDVARSEHDREKIARAQVVHAMSAATDGAPGSVARRRWRSFLRRFLPTRWRVWLRETVSWLIGVGLSEDLVRRSDVLVQVLEQRIARLEARVLRSERGHPETKLAGARPPAGGARPPLAVFTPLPPSPSGIADYAVELAPALAAHFDLMHVIADEAPEPAGDLPHVRISAWRSDESRDERTLRLYHLGNNPDHVWILDELERRPGVTMLHDGSVHHLLTFLHATGKPERLRRYIERDYGVRAADLMRLPERGIYLHYQQGFLPLRGPILDRSLGVIVHSKHLLHDLLDVRPGLRVARIPHHAAAPSGMRPRAAARNALGIAPGTFVIVSVGFVTAAKQIDHTLRALANIRDRLPHFRYQIVGFKRDDYDLESLIVRLRLGDVVELTGRVSLDRLQDHLAAADLVVNLRYPAIGESSGTLLRALAVGRACIVFDHGSFGEMPDDVVAKLPLNLGDTGALEAALLDLAGDPDRREAMERAALDHVRTEHGRDRCAALFANFVHEITAGRWPAPVPAVAASSRQSGD